MTKKSPSIKVLHFTSTSADQCGVGRYQELYLQSMGDSPEISNEIFPVSPYQTQKMTPAELDETLQQLQKELQNFDILHIQHEFSLYWHDQFAKIVAAGKASGKKVVVTVHLSPANVKEIAPVKLGGLGPRSAVTYLRQTRHHKRMHGYHIEPMRQADLVHVHTDRAAKYMQELGVDPARIVKIPHPVPVTQVPKHPASDELSRFIKKEPGDIILCLTGFLHRQKGVPAAIRALTFLPDNYKLLLAGGVKSDSDEVEYEDKMTDLIDQLGLKSRVAITGYVGGHDTLDTLIQQCDICIYPYDRVYYANANSGGLGLGFANAKPIVAYPTETIKEAAKEVEGAIVVCQNFAYYELAREVQRIDLAKQSQLSKAYADKLAWPKMAKRMIAAYQKLI